jgi:hypothetical protein
MGRSVMAFKYAPEVVLGLFDTMEEPADDIERLREVVIALDTPIPQTDLEYGTCVLCGQSPWYGGI